MPFPDANDSRHRQTSFSIPVKIFNKTAQALLDSGSVHNCIKESLVKTLHLPVTPIPTSSLQYARGASGELIYISGLVDVPLKIEGITLYTPMYVMPRLGDNIILGTPFLINNRVTMNFTERTLHMLDESITVRLQQSNDDTVSRVNHTCILKAQSHNIVQIPVPKAFLKDAPHATYMVQPVLQTGKFFVANAVVTPRNNNVPCDILNNTNHDVVLRKGTSVACLTPVDAQDVLPWNSPARVTRVSSSPDTSTSSPPADEPPDTSTRYQHNQLPNVSTQQSKRRSIQELGLKLTNPALTEQQRSQLTQLIEVNHDLFAVDVADLKGIRTKYYHTIHLKEGSQSYHTRQYRYPPHAKQEIARQVKEWEDAGLVEESTANWSNPLVLAKKKSLPGKEHEQSYRVCCDLRKLNLLTRDIAHPLPTFAEITDCLASKTINWFTAIDFRSGFLQIPLHPDSRDYTSFDVGYERKRFTKLPFGLRSSSHVFMAIMTDIIGARILGDYAQCYVDDLLLFSATWDEHIQHITEVFQRLRASGLKMHPEKSDFAVNKVKFLGFYLSKDGIEADPAKVSTIRDTPTPTTAAQVRSFVGAASFYRRFVPNFSQKVSPLNKLLGKDVPFVWTRDCESAFQQLKDALITPPVLALPDVNKPFSLFCDASYSGIAWALVQADDQGRPRAVHYSGRGLAAPEKNYHITDLEALALVCAVKELHNYICNTKTHVYTDHISLRYLQSLRSSPQGRLLRYALILQPYDLEIHYQPGKTNKLADFLSRLQWPDHVPETPDNSVLSTDICVDRINTIHAQASNTSTPSNHEPELVQDATESSLVASNEIIPEQLDPADLAAAQRRCHDLGPMVEYLQTGELPLDAKQARSIQLTHSQYFIENDLLYHTDYVHKDVTDLTPGKQLCVPVDMRQKLLQSRHEHAGHPGGAKLYLCLKPSFFWSRMFADAKACSQSCVACQANKVDTHTHKSPLQHIQADSPHHVWSIDVLSMPRSHQGYELLLVCIDNFSLYPELIPIKDQKAETIAEAIFTNVIANHGAPRRLISDRGSNFTSAVCTQLCKLLKIEHVFTASYRQQADVAECQNKLLLSTLRTIGDSDDRWQDNIPSVLLAHRSTPTPARGGLSPYFLLHGREMQVPDTVRFEAALNKKMPIASKQYVQQLTERLDIAHAIAKNHILKTQKANKRQYDKHSQNVTYKVGDKVWLRTMHTPPGHSSKLYHRYSGPYYITQTLDDYTFHLRECNTNKRLQAPVAADRLKLVVDRTHKLSYAPLSTEASHDDTPNHTVSTDIDTQDAVNTTPTVVQTDVLPATTSSTLNDVQLLASQPPVSLNATHHVRRGCKRTRKTTPSQPTSSIADHVLPIADEAPGQPRQHGRYSLRQHPKPNIALKQIDHLVRCSVDADGSRTYLCAWKDGTPPSWVLQAHIPATALQQYYIKQDQKRKRKT